MMKKWKNYYKADLFRYGDAKLDGRLKRLLKAYRKCQFATNKLLLFFYRIKFKKYKKSFNIELFGKTSIGKGLYIGHPFGITINANAVIGNNCNIHRGVLIGQENRGSRKGVPTIGNKVWIGINACIVGNVRIGDDVLIAPNTYVNCDIPSHSVAFGNPCIIKHKEGATDFYINNAISD